MEGLMKEKMKRYYDKSDKDWKLIEQRRSGKKREEVCKCVRERERALVSMCLSINGPVLFLLS